MTTCAHRSDTDTSAAGPASHRMFQSLTRRTMGIAVATSAGRTSDGRSAWHCVGPDAYADLVVDERLPSVLRVEHRQCRFTNVKIIAETDSRQAGGRRLSCPDPSFRDPSAGCQRVRCRISRSRCHSSASSRDAAEAAKLDGDALASRINSASCETAVSYRVCSFGCLARSVRAAVSIATVCVGSASARPAARLRRDRVRRDMTRWLA